MKVSTVKEIALKNFADYGYEEASLSRIAGELGIKKQSLATYFKNKEDLLFAVFNDEYKQQLAFVDESFGKQLPAKDVLYGYLDSYRKRYALTPGVKFWLRMTLFEKIAKDERAYPKIYNFLDYLKTSVQSFFPHDQYAANAYLGVFDSLCVELLLGGPDKAKTRLEASWNVYWRGVTMKGNDHE